MGEKGGEDEIGSSVSDSAQLLHIETKVEQAVAKIEKQLTIVRLISLFSEDEKLQDALMENPEQKIRFLLSTLHRGNSLKCFSYFFYKRFKVADKLLNGSARSGSQISES